MFELFRGELTVREIVDGFVYSFCNWKTDHPQPCQVFGLLVCDKIKVDRLADTAVHGT